MGARFPKRFPKGEPPPGRTEEKPPTGYLKRYGLTAAAYDAMLEAQLGLCAICRKPESRRRVGGYGPMRLAVDHCHKTGKVRALLCAVCNLMISYFENNPDRAEAGLEYIRKHST